MSRHNYVNLFGQVASLPRIPLDRSRAILAMNVIKADRNNYNSLDDIKYDSPILITCTDYYIELFSSLKPYDIIEVKGFLNTKDILKNKPCPFCGVKKSSEGNVSYISPAHVLVQKHDITAEESFKVLKDNAEISNLVILIGQLCTDPVIYRGEKIVTAQYTIAVNRKQLSDDGDVYTRTDYIHVKSYGKIAESDGKFLKKGTDILIEGMIQTRDFKKKEVCEACGKEYNWLDSVIEVVPYSVEYLHNYIPQEKKPRPEKDSSIKDMLQGMDPSLFS